MSEAETRKSTPKRKKTCKNYHTAKPEQYSGYSGYYKAFVQKMKEQEGISIREKYLETNKRADRKYKYRQNGTLLNFYFGFGT